MGKQEEHRTLVIQAGRGDRAAIESLLAHHLPAVRAFVRVHSSDALRKRESCSDLTQSVCREVLEAIDDFEYRGEAPFRAWLFTKALDKVRMRERYYRAQKRDVHKEIDVPAECSEVYGTCYADLLSPSRVALGREMLARLEAAFDELTEEQREVVALSRLGGLTRAEIADRLGRSQDSVKGLLERGLNRLSLIISRRGFGE